MDFDRSSGLYLPKGLAGSGQAKPGPNPDRAPPLDPFWVHELNRVGARVSRRYRWYWMRDMRVWGIQVHNGGDNWQTVFAHYDEESAWEGNEYPYLPPSGKALEEFCRTDLKIRFGTGDTDKDNAMRDAEVDQDKVAKKAASDRMQTERIARAVTGDDPARFQRLAQHEAAHGGDVVANPSGIRFQEFFTGFGPGKKSKAKVKK